MQATAIISTPAVNCDNRLTEGQAPAAGDFMKVLNQQVAPAQAGTEGKAPVTPEALTALLELLQQILGVTVNQPVETTQAATAQASDAQSPEAVEVTGPLEARTSDVIAAENPVGMQATTAKGQADVLNIADSITAGQVLSAEQPPALFTEAPKVQAEARNGAQSQISPQSGPIPVNLLKFTVGHDVDARLKVLQQKISQVADRLAAGKDVAGELNGLIKSFGGSQVLQEVKAMLNKLTGSAAGEVTDLTIKKANAGTFAVFNKSVDKAEAKSPDTTAEKTVKVTSEPLVQLIRNTETEGSGQQGADKGNAQNPVFTVHVPATEAQVRFNPAIPREDIKAPVNGLARWADDILGKIGEKTRLILSSGQSEMQIQLKPDFLGKVNLQVTVENGTVTARIGVENMQVKELVEANLKQLQQNLDNQGIKVSNLVVDLSANRQFQHFNRPHDHRSGKTTRFKNAEADEGYDGIPAGERVAATGIRSMDSTVEYMA